MTVFGKIVYLPRAKYAFCMGDRAKATGFRGQLEYG